MSALFVAMPPQRAPSMVNIDVPEPGILSRMLEEHADLRQRILEKPDQILTRWPTRASVGVASVKAMALNFKALEVVAKWWTSAIDQPKTVPIDLMRDEVPRYCLLFARVNDQIRFLHRYRCLLRIRVY